MSCIHLDQGQHKSCQLLALCRVCSCTWNRWMTGWIIFLVAWELHCFSKLIITAGRANRRAKMKHYPNFPHGSPLIYYFTGYFFLRLGWVQVQLIICAACATRHTFFVQSFIFPSRSQWFKLYSQNTWKDLEPSREYVRNCNWRARNQATLASYWLETRERAGVHLTKNTNNKSIHNIHIYIHIYMYVCLARALLPITMVHLCLIV